MFTLDVHDHADKRAFGQGLDLGINDLPNPSAGTDRPPLSHPTHPQSCCRTQIGGGRAMRRASK
jgi:hypothetical protein